MRSWHDDGVVLSAFVTSADLVDPPGAPVPVPDFVDFTAGAIADPDYNQRPSGWDGYYTPPGASNLFNTVGTTSNSYTMRNGRSGVPVDESTPPGEYGVRQSGIDVPAGELTLLFTTTQMLCVGLGELEIGVRLLDDLTGAEIASASDFVPHQTLSQWRDIGFTIDVSAGRYTVELWYYLPPAVDPADAYRTIVYTCSSPRMLTTALDASGWEPNPDYLPVSGADLVPDRGVPVPDGWYALLPLGADDTDQGGQLIGSGDARRFRFTNPRDILETLDVIGDYGIGHDVQCPAGFARWTVNVLPGTASMADAFIRVRDAAGAVIVDESIPPGLTPVSVVWPVPTPATFSLEIVHRWNAPPPAGSTSFVDVYHVPTDRLEQSVSAEWIDVTCDVHALTTRHGGERVLLQGVDPAAAVLELVNESGDYSPTNPDVVVRIGGTVAVSANYGGTTYPMFLGAIDRLGVTFDVDGKSITRLELVDVSARMAGDPVAFHADPTTHGRIRSLCRLSGINAGRLDVDEVFAWQLGTVRNGPVNRLAELRVYATQSAGVAYADRTGAINYRTSDVWTAAAPVVRFDARAPGNGDLPGDVPVYCPTSFDLDTALDFLRNIVELSGGPTGRDPDEATYRDDESVARYGRHPHVRTDPAWQHAADTGWQGRDEIYANIVLGQLAESINRVRSCEFSPVGRDWPAALSLFLTDPVEFHYAHPRGWGFTGSARVDGIEHRISPTRWTTVVYLSQSLPEAP